MKTTKGANKKQPTEQRESFVFYRSFKEALEGLDDSDKLIMYEAIAGYALDRTPPQLAGFPKALFSLIKPQLDANWKRYEAGVTNGWKGGEHGKKGGRPKKEKPSNNPLLTQSKPSNVNVNDNVNDNGNDNGNTLNKSRRFTPPTLQDIELFITENKISTVNPEAFFNYYDANGWMVGKSKMKNWTSAVRMWSTRNKTEKHNYKHPANDILGDGLAEDQILKF